MCFRYTTQFTPVISYPYRLEELLVEMLLGVCLLTGLKSDDLVTVNTCS